MFERYTQKARRVIFFARYEASQYGSPYIETEHLLLGLLREDPVLERRFLGTGIKQIRAEIEQQITKRERILVSMEVPLSGESKKILNFAAEEAERLAHRYVGTEHLLLGILRMEGSIAFDILRAKDVKLATVREQVANVSGAERVRSESRVDNRAMATLDGFLSGLKWHKGEDLLPSLAENMEFVDVHGKRWNCPEIEKEFETLFAPYAKKNAAYHVEETLVDTSDLLVVIVLWRNAILTSMERVWMHRMSVVLVPRNKDWSIVLIQVTPVQPK